MRVPECVHMYRNFLETFTIIYQSASRYTEENLIRRDIEILESIHSGEINSKIKLFLYRFFFCLFFFQNTRDYIFLSLKDNDCIIMLFWIDIVFFFFNNRLIYTIFKILGFSFIVLIKPFISFHVLFVIVNLIVRISLKIHLFFFIQLFIHSFVLFIFND